MAGRLPSKAVIVTGGSSGIGRAVAGRLVGEGGAVVLVSQGP
jgi:NAD(P)-dependent dehydrogenase (short-subunit alcohol dehydrogenase family)